MKQHVLFSLILAFFITAEQVSAQIVINEVQASNSETIEDVDGDSSDWVELLNTSATPFQIGGHGFSDDSTNLLKWIFPEHVMAPGERLLVWCSGKDLRFPSEEQVLRTNSTIQVRPTVLTLDQPWKYLTGAPESGRPPNFWNHSDFDDFTWPTGYPGFGFGDGDDRTELERGIGALFLRTTFDAPDIAAFENMVFQANYDDGFVLWLNGHRLLSVNFPEDVEPTFDSNSNRSREARRMQRWMTRDWVEHLQPQNNLLAVAVLNRTHSSNDMSFLPEIGTIDPSFHASFELDSDGEMVLLTSPAGEIIDGINLPEQSQDRTYGRVPDGTGEFGYLFYPTPGETNDTHVTENMISTDVEFTPPGGFQNGATNVSLSAEIPFDDFQIRYTTNGTAPTTSSTLYSGPISIARDTVIRAAGYLAGRLVLNPTSESYFITRRDFVLPVLSLSMNPNDYSNVHNNSGGRGRGSEVASFLEIFNANGEQDLKTGFGMRLHGGAGRGGDFNTKKAYKAYFRGVYGDTKMRYPDFMPESDLEEFDKFVLRSSFNDAIGRNGNGSLLRDQLIRDLHRDMGAPASHGTWCNLYVNMAYRGVYNIVERMDEEFMEAYFPDEGDDWDVIKTGNDVLVGDNREWNRLGDFMDDNNLSSNAVYDQFAEMVDIENYTSYMIVNMWAQNHDWPHNNWYASRPRIEGGKWRFFCWDAEFGISLSPGGYTSDTFSFVFGRNGQLADIIDALVDNVGYRRYFVTQVENALSGPLSSANSRGRLNDLRAVILPDIADELDLVDRSRSNWDRNVSTMNTFLSNRNGPFLNHINNSSRLDFPPDQTPILRSVTPDEIVNTGGVEVRIRGVRLNRDTRIFFNDVEAEVLDYLGLIGGLNVRVPFDGSLTGPVSVRARNDDADVEVEEEGLFTILLPAPVVTGLQPDTGSAEGGETVFLSGGNFLEGVTVFFGDQEAPSVTRFGPKNDSTVLLQVTTPPGQGPVEVRAVNTQPGRAESVDSVTFTYRSPVGYIRGDPDSSGDVNLTDAVLLLNYLFSGGTEPGCPAAADTDRNGEVDMSDAIRILNYLFVGGAELLAPFPECGQDPLGELLSCPAASNCQ